MLNNWVICFTLQGQVRSSRPISSQEEGILRVSFHLFFSESSGHSTLLAYFICSSDAQRAPRRYSGSPDPRDDRRERDPRSATGRATYDEVAPPPAEARY